MSLSPLGGGGGVGRGMGGIGGGEGQISYFKTLVSLVLHVVLCKLSEKAVF